MESLECRSPRACAACPWSDKRGACQLEAQVDLALDALEARPALVVHARRATALA